MCAILVKENDIVNINVGGKKLACKRSTLTGVPGSLLEAMFSGRWEDRLEKDDKGQIFLDLNPYAFGKVLDWLRAKRIESIERPAPLPVIAKDQEEEWKNLVTYLGLDDHLLPSTRDSFDETLKSAAIQLSNNNLIATNTNSHHYVLGKNIINKGVASWTLQAVGLHNNNWMYFGVIDVSKVALNNDFSYSHVGSYGWAGGAQVYVGGANHASLGGWNWGVKQGDKIKLELNLNTHQLSLTLERTNATYLLTLPQGGEWNLHINIHGNNDVVQLLEAKWL